MRRRSGLVSWRPVDVNSERKRGVSCLFVSFFLDPLQFFLWFLWFDYLFARKSVFMSRWCPKKVMELKSHRESTPVIQTEANYSQQWKWQQNYASQVIFFNVNERPLVHVVVRFPTNNNQQSTRVSTAQGVLLVNEVTKKGIMKNGSWVQHPPCCKRFRCFE